MRKKSAFEGGFFALCYTARMKMVVVNEQDEELGYKERDDRSKTDIIRISAAWILNDKGEVLITQRAFSKVHDPGKWHPSAAGTVEEGESYAQNIVKEIQEELGITVEENQLIKGEKYLRETSHKYFCQVFFVRRSVEISDLVLQRDEVEAARWISVPKLIAWHHEEPQDFVASLGDYLGELEKFVR